MPQYMKDRLTTVRPLPLKDRLTTVRPLPLKDPMIINYGAFF